MADKIEWVKLALTNWKTIVAIVTMLMSWIGYQETVLAEKEQVIEDTQQQVANVARHYVKTVIVEKSDGKQDCTKICTTINKKAINHHLKEFH